MSAANLPQTPSIAHDAIAARCGIAAASAAASLAAAGDTPGMVHARRTIMAAIQAAETLRPASHGGSR